MANSAYLYDDWIKDLSAGAIAITDEDSDYPETNLQGEQVASCTRTTAKVAIKFQFDFGVARQPQAFAVLNHNFSGGTFDINSYTADDYATGKITVENDKTMRLLDCYHRESSAPATRRYWEFDFTNCTSNDIYFEIGRHMAYSDFTQLQEPQESKGGRGYGYKNIVNETTYGVRWVHKLTKNKERFLLHWSVRTDADIPGELRALFESVFGDAHPFFYVPDLDSTDGYYVYCNQNELTWNEFVELSNSTLVADVNVELIEAVRGKV